MIAGLSGGLDVNATPTATVNVSLSSTGPTTLAAGQQLVLSCSPPRPARCSWPGGVPVAAHGTLPAGVEVALTR